MYEKVTFSALKVTFTILKVIFSSLKVTFRNVKTTFSRLKVTFSGAIRFHEPLARVCIYNTETRKQPTYPAYPTPTCIPLNIKH